jgi:hypothetical protein
LIIRTIPGFGKYLSVPVAEEAVWPAIRADFDLRCFYERLTRGKGANKANMAGIIRILGWSSVTNVSLGFSP